MSHDLCSSLDSLVAVSSAASSLLVRDVAGECRPAKAEEVLQAAQRVLAGRVRGAEVLTSPAVVKDFLRARMGSLPHEIFAVVHLDTQHRVLDYVEMFRGTVIEAAHPERKIVFTKSGDFAGEWDAGRVSQMLVNLVTNVLNHGLAYGEVRVTLMGYEQDFVTLQVQNLGPVIPDSVRAGMFQPLNRVTADRRGMPAGSSGLGLGLYIAHESQSPTEARWK